MGRDRAAAGDTAPAEGLYLVQVLYADTFALPSTPDGTDPAGGLSLRGKAVNERWSLLNCATFR